MAYFAKIWAILPGNSPFCLDLGYFAWILAILLRFGPQRRRTPEDGAGGDVRTYGQIPPVFYRTSSPSGPLPKKAKLIPFDYQIVLIALPKKNCKGYGLIYFTNDHQLVFDLIQEIMIV